MMGIEVIPHDERYQRTESYVEILKGLWTSPPGTFNHSSKWYKITDGWVSPLPVSKPHPPIANAGMSEHAKRMVARLCNWAFISLRESADAAPIRADLRERAGNHGRTIKISTYPMVLWADTEREAEQERRKLVEHLDLVAAEKWARGLSDKSGPFDRYTLEMFAIGAGALPIVGTAEQAAEQIAALYRMGIDGLPDVLPGLLRRYAPLRPRNLAAASSDGRNSVSDTRPGALDGAARTGLSRPRTE